MGMHQVCGQVIGIVAQSPSLAYRRLSRAQYSPAEQQRLATSYYTMKTGKVYPPILLILTKEPCYTRCLLKCHIPLAQRATLPKAIGIASW
jgi:hypothetical protein